MAGIPPDDDPGADPGSDEGIGTLLVRLVDDGKQFARAEIGLWRARLLVRLDAAKAGLALAAVALLLANAAAIGLVVGLILIAAAALGPLWATLIVVTASLALAGVMGWLAIGKLRRATGEDELLP